MYVQVLPVLQDFVPLQGQSPAYQKGNHNQTQQGKGTEDHLLPSGDWFLDKSIFEGLKQDNLSRWT